MAICWTNAKEEEALERYKLITGNIVLFPKFQVHGKNSLEMIGLQLSSDGLVDKCSGLNSRGVLKIMTFDQKVRNKVRQFEWNQIRATWVVSSMEITQPDHYPSSHAD
ncbi:hypothetical protein NC652_020377 [Populus alba x Populus x berolinensis]|nr:hypothetical protein NC652_020377 [Populus alba x Populus x berolinensis]